MNPCHWNVFTGDRLKKDGSRPAGLLATVRATFYGALMFGFLCALLAAAQPAQAQTESVVYTFLYGTGDGPNSSLLMSGNNLYGTTQWGGDPTSCPKSPLGGCGVAFEMTGAQ